MNTVRRSILSTLVLALSIASGAWAVDEGQTKPRLNANWVNTNTTVDVIPLTSGSGNIKGFVCRVSPPAPGYAYPVAKLHFYVDGGAAQTIDPMLVPGIDSEGIVTLQTVPMNVRFESSIRVTLQKTGGYGDIYCAVSWGLD
jgi:hypothetical protein